MMKQYTTPKVEVSLLELQDILTGSVESTGDTVFEGYDHDKPWL